MLLIVWAQPVSSNAIEHLEQTECSESDSIPLKVFVAASALAYSKDTTFQCEGSSEPKSLRELSGQVLASATVTEESLPGDWATTAPSDARASLRLYSPPGMADPVYILAFRGSQFEIGDWLANLQGFVGLVPGQYSQALQLTEDVFEKAKMKHRGLVVTGHSLGGGKADYVAAKLGLVAVTFNSSHLSNPADVNPGTRIETYRITAAHWYADAVSSDRVGTLRLGGNFEQTRVHPIPISRGLASSSHALARFYCADSSVLTRRVCLRSRTPQQVVPGLDWAMVRRSPTLVADVPELVRDGVRRGFINSQSAVRSDPEVRPNVWDLRFRVGTVYDTRPTSGFPVENARILEDRAPPPDTRFTSAFGEYWHLESSSSFPLTSFGLPNWAFSADLEDEGAIFDQKTPVSRRKHDGNASLLGLGAGILRTDAQSRPDRAVLGIRGRWRRLERDEIQLAYLTGGEIAGAVHGPWKSLLWGDLGITHVNYRHVRRTPEELRRSSLLYEGRLGLRTPINGPDTISQIRFFFGRNDMSGYSPKLIFGLESYLECGLGVSISQTLGRFRFFAEPTIRWRDYDRPEMSSNDREYGGRVEVGYLLDYSLGRSFALTGWELVLSYGISRTDAEIPRNGNYLRQLISATMNKQF